MKIKKYDQVICPDGMGCGVDIGYVCLDEVGYVLATGVYSDGTIWYHVVWGDREPDDYWIHWDDEVELYVG